MRKHEGFFGFAIVTSREIHVRMGHVREKFLSSTLLLKSGGVVQWNRPRFYKRNFDIFIWKSLHTEHCMRHFWKSLKFDRNLVNLA